MLEGSRFDDLFEPVGIAIENRIRSVGEFLNLLRRIPGTLSYLVVSFVVQLGKGGGIYHIQQAGGLLDSQVIGKCDLRFSFFLSPLRGYQDDTVCGARPVNSGRGIFQDGDGFYIIRIQKAERFPPWNAINNY